MHADNHRCMPTNTDACRQSPMYADRQTTMHAESCRQSPIDADNHRCMPTITDVCRQSPMYADRHHRCMPTITDRCRQSPVHADNHRCMPTITDRCRQLPVHADNHRCMPTITDACREWTDPQDTAPTKGDRLLNSLKKKNRSYTVYTPKLVTGSLTNFHFQHLFPLPTGTSDISNTGKELHSNLPLVLSQTCYHTPMSLFSDSYQ
jgi:hypothetical protein